MNTPVISFNSSGILKITTKGLNVIIVLFSTFLIAVLAQISIPIPFSPVPITGQTIGVVLVGSLLGSKKGAAAICLYIFEGVIGLPVFAQMKAGPHVLFGPTAGYIFGFIIAAYIAGIFSEKGFTKNPTQCFVSCFISTTIILFSGALYISFFKGINDALILGFYPFLVGDVIKSGAAALLITSLRRV
tara:strand:+ start:869 stop:1432 length:564 start_codon:yes stop_codon:yes gene_type:complete